MKIKTKHVQKQFITTVLKTNITDGLSTYTYIKSINIVSRGKFYTFLSLDTFSRPESGDSRKKYRKVGPSKIYLQEKKGLFDENKGYVFF